MSDQFWDPTGEPITEEDLKPSLKKTEKKVERAMKYRKYYGIIIVVSILLLIFYDLGTGLFIGIIGYAIIIGMRTSLVRDVIKKEVADKKGWLYAPENPKSKLYSKYKSIMPELFSRPGYAHTFDDIFWGKVPVNGYTCNFVSGVFRYTVKQGKNSSKTYDEHFFIIQSPKKVSTRFALYSRSLLVDHSGTFPSKKISTQSMEFSKEFRISKSENINNTEVRRILSPKVQEEFLNFENGKGMKSFGLFFKDDIIAYSSQGKLSRKVKTRFNIFSDINIKEEEINYVEENLHEITSFLAKIIKYND